MAGLSLRAPKPAPFGSGPTTPSDAASFFESGGWGVPSTTYMQVGAEQQAAVTAAQASAPVGFMGTAADLGLGAAQGATGLVEGVGTLYGLATGRMDNPMRTFGAEAGQALAGMESPTLQARRQIAQDNIRSADGFFAKLFEGGKQYVTDPRLLSSELMKQAVVMAPGIFAGRAVAGFGATAELANAGGTATAVGVSAIQQGADIASQTYNDARKSGASVDQALEAARSAFAMSAAASLATVAAMPGGASIESALVGAGRTAVAGPARGFANRFARGFAGEAGQEGAEEGLGQMAGNVARQNIGQNVPLLEGVPEAAGAGGVLGGIMGGPISLLQRNEGLARSPRTADQPPVTEAPPPPAAPPTTQDLLNPTPGPTPNGTVGYPPTDPYAPLNQAYDQMQVQKLGTGLSRTPPSEAAQQVETLPPEFFDPTHPLNAGAAPTPTEAPAPTGASEQAAATAPTPAASAPTSTKAPIAEPSTSQPIDQQVAEQQRNDRTARVIAGGASSEDLRTSFDETKALSGGLEALGNKAAQARMGSLAIGVMNATGNKIDALAKAIENQRVSKAKDAPEFGAFLERWYENLTGTKYDAEKPNGPATGLQPAAGAGTATGPAAGAGPVVGAGAGVGVSVQPASRPAAQPPVAGGPSVGERVRRAGTDGTREKRDLARQRAGEALNAELFGDEAKAPPPNRLVDVTGKDVPAERRLRLAARLENSAQLSPEAADQLASAPVRAAMVAALRNPTVETWKALQEAVAADVNAREGRTGERGAGRPLTAKQASEFANNETLIPTVEQMLSAMGKAKKNTTQPFIYDRTTRPLGKDDDGRDAAPGSAARAEYNAREAERKRLARAEAAEARKALSAQPGTLVGTYGRALRSMQKTAATTVNVEARSDNELAPKGHVPMTEELRGGLQKALDVLSADANSAIGIVNVADAKWQPNPQAVEEARETRQLAENISNEISAIIEDGTVSESWLNYLRQRLRDEGFLWDDEPDLFSRPTYDSTPEGTVTIGQAQKVVNRLTAKVPGMPPVIVRQSPKELNEEAHRAGARGAFVNGKVYLFADNLHSDAEVEFVLLHETVGHYGLRSVLGDRLNDTLDALLAEDTGLRTAAEAFAKEKGVDLRLAAEEVIADLAGENKELPFWLRLGEAIVKALRAVGFTKVADWLADAVSNSFTGPPTVTSLLRQSNWYVRTAQPRSTYGGTVFARAASTPVWFSALINWVEQAPRNDGLPSVWKREINDQIARANVKKEEIEWYGINEFLDGLDGKTKIPKEMITTWLRGNELEVVDYISDSPDRDRRIKAAAKMAVDARIKKDVAAAEDKEAALDEAADNRYEWIYEEERVRGLWNVERSRETTNYADMTLGGQTTGKYRMIIMAVPKLDERFTHKVHTHSVRNPVVFARTDIRTLADGRKVLFVNELQSDWAQQGAKHGFKKAPNDPQLVQLNERAKALRAQMRELIGNERTPQNAAQFTALNSELEGIYAEMQRINDGDIEPGPFVTSTIWKQLALKRLLRMAADDHLDGIAFSANESQIYDIEKWPADVVQRGFQVGGVIKHYLTDMPNVVNKFAKKFGVQVEKLASYYAPYRAFDTEKIEKALLTGDKSMSPEVFSELESVFHQVEMAADAYEGNFSEMLNESLSQEVEWGTHLGQWLKDKESWYTETPIDGQPFNALMFNDTLREYASRPQPLFSRPTSVRMSTPGIADSEWAKRAKEEFAGGKANLKDWFGRTWKSTLHLRTLVDTYAGILPAAKKLGDALFEKEASVTELATSVDQMVRDFEQLSDRAALQNLLYDETAVGVFANKDWASQKYLNEAVERRVAVTKQTPAQAKADLQAEHNGLRQAYLALNPPAKQMYNRVHQLMYARRKSLMKAMERFIIQLEPNTEARKARLKEAQKAFTYYHGPYFPMLRFGDYGVAAYVKDQLVEFSFVESAAEARKLEADLKARHKDAEVSTFLRNQGDKIAGNTRDIQFVNKIQDMVTKNVTDDPALRKLLKDNLHAIFVSALPEMHARQRFLPRKNVPGFTRDAVRTLGQHILSSLRYEASLKFNPRVSDALQDATDQASGSPTARKAWVLELETTTGQRVVEAYDNRHDMAKRVGDSFDAGQYKDHRITPVHNMVEAQEAIKDARGDAKVLTPQISDALNRPYAGDSTTKGQVVGEIRQRLQNLLDPDTPKIVQLAGNFTYLFHLGLTPSFVLANLSQNPLVTMPMLAAKFGGRRAATVMAKHMKSTLTNARKAALAGWKTGTFDVKKLEGLSADERELLDYLLKRNVLDLTQSIDLGRAAEGGSPLWDKVMRYGTLTGHYSEIFNRLVAALTAFELSADREGGGDSNFTDKQARFAYVYDVISRTHGDYSAINRPGIMTRSNLLRLAFQFRNYTFMMTHHLLTMANDAMRGETAEVKAEARRMLMYTMGTGFMLAGLRGLPFYSAFLLAAAILGIDDPEEQMIMWAQRATGSRAAGEVLVKGLPILSGGDMSNRVGLGTTLPFVSSFLMNDSLSGQEKLTRTFWDLTTGPFGGIVLNYGIKAPEYFAQGDLVRAAEQIEPKVIRDISQAVRFAYGEGVTNKRGDVLLAADSVGMGSFLWKLAGVQPADVARAYEERGYIVQLAKKATDERGQLITRYRAAAMAGDFETMDAVRKEGAAWSEKNPAYAIKPKQWFDAVRRQNTRQMILDETGGRAATKPEQLLVNSLLSEYEQQLLQ